eukprot:5189204-Alexandrium_andersonii.AAC.1
MLGGAGRRHRRGATRICWAARGARAELSSAERPGGRRRHDAATRGQGAAALRVLGPTWWQPQRGGPAAAQAYVLVRGASIRTFARRRKRAYFCAE